MSRTLLITFGALLIIACFARCSDENARTNQPSKASYVTLAGV